MNAHHSTRRWSVLGLGLAVIGALAVAAPAHAADANGTLVFQRTDFANFSDHGLKAVNPDGSGLRTVVSQQHAMFHDPSWSPDGTRIAVSKWGPATGGLDPMPGQDIWVMDADGGNLHNVTNSPDDSDYTPLWSPNGAFLAYERWFPRSDTGSADIWLHSPAAGQHLALTATPEVNELPAAWSPDGSKLLFTSRVVDASGWGARIEVLRADGTGRTVLADVPAEGPVWSPDGSRIAYSRVMSMVANRTADGPDELPTYDIWVMNADGTNPVNLTGTAQPSETEPQWSPDGSKIAFVSGGDVWSMNPDGSGKVDLTATAYPAERGPVWSPDGSLLAYARDDEPDRLSTDSGYTSIWVMNADGTSPRKLTSGDYWDHDVAWQPRPITGLALVDPATGIWHLDGRSFYYGDPGDYPMLGDWDCDGVETPGLYRQADGYVYLRNSLTAGIADVRFYFGDPGDVPLAGDFDGDGCDTVSLYRPSEGRVYVVNQLGSRDAGLGAADVSYYFGNPSDRPFVGDFDGDGVDTVGLHRAATGLVYFRNSHTAGTADSQFVYGDPGDRLVCHDWTGRSGGETLAVFRPADGRFYFRFANTAGVADATLRWGESDWIPVAGALG